MFHLKVPKPLEWGDAAFVQDTVLYSDWSYIQATSGGFNSFGGGIPAASISVAWEKSQWTYFIRKVKRTLVDIDSVCSHREVTMTGFVSFMALEDDTPLKQEMEGADWIAAVMCSEHPINPSVLSLNPWVVVFFRKDCISIPLNTWHKIRQPINVLGEIMKIEICLEFGRCTCFVKARAAAFIISTNII